MARTKPPRKPQKANRSDSTSNITLEQSLSKSKDLDDDWVPGESKVSTSIPQPANTKRKRKSRELFLPSSRQIIPQPKKKSNKNNLPKSKSPKKISAEEKGWMKKGYENMKAIEAEFLYKNKTYYKISFLDYNTDFDEFYTEKRAAWNDDMSKGEGKYLLNWIQLRDSTGYTVSETDVYAEKFATPKFLPGAYVIGKGGGVVGQVGVKCAWPLQSVEVTAPKKQKRATPKQTKKKTKKKTGSDQPRTPSVTGDQDTNNSSTTSPTSRPFVRSPSDVVRKSPTASTFATSTGGLNLFSTFNDNADVKLERSVTVQPKKKAKPSKKKTTQSSHKASPQEKAKPSKAKSKQSSDNVSSLPESAKDMHKELFCLVYELHATGKLESLGIPTVGRKVMLQNIVQIVCARHDVYSVGETQQKYASVLRKFQNLRVLLVNKMDDTVEKSGGKQWLNGVKQEDLALRMLSLGFITPVFICDTFQILDLVRPLTVRHVRLVLLHLVIRLVWLRKGVIGKDRSKEVGRLNKITLFGCDEDCMKSTGWQGQMLDGLVYDILGVQHEKIVKAIVNMLGKWEASGTLVESLPQSDPQNVVDTSLSLNTHSSDDKHVLSPKIKQVRSALEREQTTPTQELFRVIFLSLSQFLYSPLFCSVLYVFFGTVLC